MPPSVSSARCWRCVFCFGGVMTEKESIELARLSERLLAMSVRLEKLEKRIEWFALAVFGLVITAVLKGAGIGL